MDIEIEIEININININTAIDIDIHIYRHTANILYLEITKAFPLSDLFLSLYYKTI
jgi:hypothetical protein